jgi:hypothetical protein
MGPHQDLGDGTFNIRVRETGRGNVLDPHPAPEEESGQEDYPRGRIRPIGLPQRRTQTKRNRLSEDQDHRDHLGGGFRLIESSQGRIITKRTVPEKD